MTLRWTGLRKAEALFIIDVSRQMTEEEFCEQYDSTPEEIQSWRLDPVIDRIVSKLKERTA